MVFGSVVVLLALAIIAYYVYRQAVDPGISMFPGNVVDHNLQVNDHPCSESPAGAAQAAAGRNE